MESVVILRITTPTILVDCTGCGYRAPYSTVKPILKNAQHRWQLLYCRNCLPWAWIAIWSRL